jgi:hypothetical protein
MPPKKKMVSLKDCERVSKIQSQNAVNAYRKKSSGDRSSPNEYAMFVKQHMQDVKVKRLPVRERMGAIALLWADFKKKQHVIFMDMSDFDDKPSKPKGNFREINKARQKLIKDDEKKQ